MNHLSCEILDPLKLPLVQRFYKQHYPIAKAKRDEQICIAKLTNQLCAVVRFRHIGSTYRLLTGMAVSRELREQGIGHQLLSYCEENVLDQQVFCFAYRHLESFYHQHHFVTQSVHELPAEIKQLYLRYSHQGREILPMRYFPLFQD
ncbi:GNAT family N-acetyltransferase [Vibrio mangrovi]|uniref:GNAT family N-acetyltransferase n=1 Tax=Vibrio mangrovi TaxID=474394 RepID=A0A1Y6IUV5_9VIBR|nr:GNAT family N-acetyltransferase [Vibrio mangrovi]MDW6002115.1 GNAT family N-acetyltransferase [Vibrio mangrovi]SMS01457.1 hypothetical protein VIM7927_02753 [Vibrio mangrovi]